MKYVNQFLLILIISLISIVSYLGITGTWSALFIIPLIIISGYIIYFLHKQFEVEEIERIEKNTKLAVEDNEAQDWIQNKFVPQAISYGKTKRRTIIIYFTIFLIGIYFLWHFISFGLMPAIINTAIAGFIFLIFLFYVSFMNSNFSQLTTLLPLRSQKYISGNWARAYLYLLPISLISYLIYPVETFYTDLINKLQSIPLILLIYTFLFLGLYCIIYLYTEIKKDEEEKIKKEINNVA